jgi:hypothetical protein
LRYSTSRTQQRFEPLDKSRLTLRRRTPSFRIWDIPRLLIHYRNHSRFAVISIKKTNSRCLRRRQTTGTLLAFKLTARTSLLLVSSNTSSVPASAMQYELDEMGIPNNYADGDHSVDQKAHWNRQREQVMVRKLREKQRNCGTIGRCLRI